MPRRSRMISLVAALATFLGTFLGAATASGTDWTPVADEGVVEVVTRDEDGDLRTTKVWIAVLDGEAFIRTGRSRWGRNLVRDAELRILSGDASYDLRAEFVTDEAARARVVGAFREKYGFSDRLATPFRGRNPKIMRLIARDGDE